jgi:hypothetical protein
MKEKRFLGSRKRLLLLGGLAALLLMPLVAVVSVGGAGAVSNIAPAQSLFALLSARSPGDRTTAQLSDTKAARKVAVTPPRQRALPKVRPAKALDEYGELLLMPEEPFIPELAALPTIPYDFGSPGGGSSTTPGGGGGGCCGGGGGGGDDTIPGDVPAVPEPATWAMLLIGVFGCGSMLRRRPRGELSVSR